MKKYLFLSLALAVAMIFIIGCNGGSSESTTPGSTLRIGVDTAMTSTAAAARDRVAIGAPLDSGATIDVFDLRTGNRITSGTIGADGFGNVQVTGGLGVSVVVTGKRLTKDYRFSYIIGTTPNGDETFILTPATTIASELLVKNFPHKLIDNNTFNAEVNKATEWLIANPGSQDLSIGSGVLTSGNLGDGAYDAIKLKSLIDELPLTIDDNVVKAKNAVQQIKEVGMPWASVASTEQASLQQAQTDVNETIKAINLDAVNTKYNALSSRLNTLLLPAITGDWKYYENGISQGWNYPMLELTVGKGYLAEEVSGNGWTYLKFSLNNSADTPGQITVKLVKSDGTYTVVAKRIGDSWDITQTFTGDTLQVYHVVYPFISDPVTLGANPTFSASISLKDKDITTPMTFNGTVSAIGNNEQSYTKISYNGTLDTGEIKATANMEAHFPATLPAGAPAGAKTYDYPTSFTLSNASITGNYGDVSASIKGNITATATNVTGNSGDLVARPTKFELTDAEVQVSKGISSATIKGTIKVNGHYEPQAGHDDMLVPENVLLSGSAQLIDHGRTISLNGELAGDGGQVVTYNGKSNAVPKHVLFKGEYSNSDSGTKCTGSIEATWDNPGSTQDKAKGKITILGTLDRKNYRAYEVNIVAVADGNGNVTCTINKIAWGACSLTGEGTCKVTATQSTDISIKLTNQDGVVFNLTRGNISNTDTGNITVNSVIVANIVRDVNTHKLVITYTDSTTDALPI